MIGLEKRRPHRSATGLINWYLDQTGVVDGYARAIFSGFTVKELARVLGSIADSGEFEGLWHVAAPPISKYELLSCLSDRLAEPAAKVRRVNGPSIDRSLDGRAFAQKAGYVAPDWDSQLDELAAEINQARGENLD
jgi:dTDP-4-dehydrorhamnose reductase